MLAKVLVEGGLLLGKLFCKLGAHLFNLLVGFLLANHGFPLRVLDRFEHFLVVAFFLFTCLTLLLELQFEELSGLLELGLGNFVRSFQLADLLFSVFQIGLELGIVLLEALNLSVLFLGNLLHLLLRNTAPFLVILLGLDQLFLDSGQLLLPLKFSILSLLDPFPSFMLHRLQPVFQLVLLVLHVLKSLGEFLQLLLELLLLLDEAGTRVLFLLLELGLQFLFFFFQF